MKVKNLTLSYGIWLSLVTFIWMAQFVLIKFLTTLHTIKSLREAGAKF